jgi:hypothetical protein
MSSIYDDPAPNVPSYQPPKPFAADPVTPSEAYTPPFAKQNEPPPKKRGCGCLGCFLGCLGVLVVLAIVGAIGAYVVAQKAPDFIRETIAKGINESDLKPEDKKMVLQQVDRLVEGYKADKVDLQKLGQLAEDFVQSPLMDLLIAFGAKVKYIDKSGLTPEEKTEAERTLHRVARGVIEEKISQEQLDIALNHISNKVGQSRQFKDEVTDEELRAFLQECKRLADEAMIPDEDVQVDIGGELKKLVDKALGEAHDEAPDSNASSTSKTDAEAPPDTKTDAKSTEPKLEEETKKSTGNKEE